MTLKSNLSLKSLAMKTALAFSLALPISFAVTGSANAQVKNCKIKVVGGSFKGRSFAVQMKDGQFTNVKGMLVSELPGCRGKKKVYGRWYHLCKKGTLIVFKRKSGKWVKLYPKSLLKYQHTCF